jgi:carbon storage regulator
MLVLSRKSGQKIRINDTIVITVLDVQHGLVKVGIDAPRDIAVYREELYKEIREANQQAASTTMELPRFGKPVTTALPSVTQPDKPADTASG